MGYLGVGEAARGKQLIANQGQVWIGIRTRSKRIRISNSVKRRVGPCERGKISKSGKQGDGLTRNHHCCVHTSVHVCIIYVICEEQCLVFRLKINHV
jgi:hypothetical protein